MLVQLTRDVMYGEMFWLERSEDPDNDYVYATSGMIGTLHNDGTITIDEVDDISFFYPEDSYTEANPL